MAVVEELAEQERLTEEDAAAALGAAFGLYVRANGGSVDEALAEMSAALTYVARSYVGERS